jgi:hypothetical protein
MTPKTPLMSRYLISAPPSLPDSGIDDPGEDRTEGIRDPEALTGGRVRFDTNASAEQVRASLCNGLWVFR